MGWKSKRSGGLLWRNYLTVEERRELAEIERGADKLDAARRELTTRRNLIVNRAIQRARYEQAEKLRKQGV